MKIFELLTVMPDEQFAALAIVPAMFIGMRMLYGAWPWESQNLVPHQTIRAGEATARANQ